MTGHTYDMYLVPFQEVLELRDIIEYGYVHNLATYLISDFIQHLCQEKEEEERRTGQSWCLSKQEKRSTKKGKGENDAYQLNVQQTTIFGHSRNLHVTSSSDTTYIHEPRTCHSSSKVYD